MTPADWGVPMVPKRLGHRQPLHNDVKGFLC